MLKVSGYLFHQRHVNRRCLFLEISSAKGRSSKTIFFKMYKSFKNVFSIFVGKKNIIKIPIGTILNVFGTQSRFDHTTEIIDFSYHGE